MRTAPRGRTSVHVVAPGVRFVQTPLVNWIVLSGDGTITLIDAGYPRDLRTLMLILDTVDGELTTILVTHGHADHIGGIRRLRAASTGVRVLGAAAELPNISREVTHQVGPRELIPRLWRPSVLGWTVRAVLRGGLARVAVAAPEAIEPGRTHRFSGHEVVPIPTPGHTPGHLAYWLPEPRILVSGDAVVTGHPTSKRYGTQLLASYFNSDEGEARRSMDAALDRPIAIMLPGHGPLRRFDHPASPGAQTHATAR